MKKTVCLLSLIGLALLTGCSALSGAFVSHTPTVVRPGQTNVVERYRTNWVQVTSYVTNLVTLQAASTNAAGQLVPAVIQPQIVPTSSAVPVVTTNLDAVVLPPVTVDMLGLSAPVSGAVSLAGNLAPVPWAGGAANLLLAAAGGIFGLVNHFRVRKATGEKTTWKAAAQVGVHGIEQLRTAALTLPGYTPALDKQVMQGIVAMQYATGTKEVIGDIVDRETDHTVPQGFLSQPKPTT